MRLRPGSAVFRMNGIVPAEVSVESFSHIWNAVAHNEKRLATFVMKQCLLKCWHWVVKRNNGILHLYQNMLQWLTDTGWIAGYAAAHFHIASTKWAKSNNWVSNLRILLSLIFSVLKRFLKNFSIFNIVTYFWLFSILSKMQGKRIEHGWQDDMDPYFFYVVKTTKL